MKLLFRTYLASLRERDELDAILPDLLSELGYTVYSRPQRGTTQAGVDIAAVGKDEDGERKLFLFSVKQGDLTRQSWDGTPQALRSSLNEILDNYIPHRIPKRYEELKIVICLVFGGDMQEQVRSNVNGYILGRIALTGLWVHWLIERDSDAKRRAAAQERVSLLASMGYQLINNNRVLFLPLQDQQAIEIALFLVFVGTVNGSTVDARVWLHEMVGRLVFAVRTHGLYPCVLTEYRDLVAHPRERTDDYRKEATSGSILIPLLAAFLSALNDHEALEQLVALKAKDLQHCTLQLWMPDKSSEDGIYVGTHDHGVALCDLPLSATGNELLDIVRAACNQSKDFDELSAITTDYWPIVLTACRHYRLPVPPQFWIRMVEPLPAPADA